jgi:hypothetical protein
LSSKASLKNTENLIVLIFKSKTKNAPTSYWIIVISSFLEIIWIIMISPFNKLFGLILEEEGDYLG